MPHTPFGTFLAGVSATGSKDPAGSTGIRPTYVFLCQFNSCRIFNIKKIDKKNKNHDA